MGQIEDTEDAKVNWHWRDSMKPVQFFGVDARAAIPFAVLLVYFRTSSVIFAIVSTMIFVAFEKRGLTFPCALRAIRSWFNGQKRPAWVSIRRKKFQDYG